MTKKRTSPPSAPGNILTVLVMDTDRRTDAQILRRYPPGAVIVRQPEKIRGMTFDYVWIDEQLPVPA